VADPLPNTTLAFDPLTNAQLWAGWILLDLHYLALVTSGCWTCDPPLRPPEEVLSGFGKSALRRVVCGLLAGDQARDALLDELQALLACYRAASEEGDLCREWVRVRRFQGVCWRNEVWASGHGAVLDVLEGVMCKVSRLRRAPGGLSSTTLTRYPRDNILFADPAGLSPLRAAVEQEYSTLLPEQRAGGGGAEPTTKNRPDAASPAGRGKEGHTEERMIAILRDNPESLNWSAETWALELGFRSSSTIKETHTWKTTIRLARVRERAEREAREERCRPRRRGRRG
jgi:hypothetical protein